MARVDLESELDRLGPRKGEGEGAVHLWTGQSSLDYILRRLRNFSGESGHADAIRKRAVVPGRGRCADGTADAPPLGAGVVVRTGGECRRRAGEGPALRRKARRVS